MEAPSSGTDMETPFRKDGLAWPAPPPVWRAVLVAAGGLEPRQRGRSGAHCHARKGHDLECKLIYLCVVDM